MYSVVTNSSGVYSIVIVYSFCSANKGHVVYSSKTHNQDNSYHSIYTIAGNYIEHYIWQSGSCLVLATKLATLMLSIIDAHIIIIKVKLLSFML